MNEEIQQRITKYLDAIEASAQGAGDFVSEQAPMVAQEYLAWVFWSSALGAVGLMVAGVTGLVFSVLFLKQFLKNKEFIEHPEAMLTAIPIIIAGLAVGVGLQNAGTALKVSVAPRVVLLEKVSELSR